MRKSLLTVFAVLFSLISYAALTPITGGGTVCGGNSLVMTNATPGGTWSLSTTALGTISWTTGTTSSAVFAAASVGTAGTVTVTYTLGAEEVYNSVTVNPSPAPIVGPPALCNHDIYVTYTSATPGGVWSCGGTAFDSISATSGSLYHLPGCASACGADIITYTLPTGCSVSRSVTVNPIVVAYMPPDICLSSGTATASGTPSGGTWSGSAPAVATIDATSGIITPLSAGTVILTYNLLGCIISNFGAPTIVRSGITNHYVINPPDTTCNGPDFFINTCGGTAYNITTYFGDGTFSNIALGTGSSAHFPHTYAYPGTYTVKQILYSGTTTIDSVQFSYEYNFCRTIPIKIFNDNNSNCIYDAADWYNHNSLTIRVDSNSIPIDTLPASSGLYYKAYGPAGTIYSFRIISKPNGLVITCPTGGIIYDTITSYTNTYTRKWFGVEGGAPGTFDLTGHVSNRCGRHTMSTIIYVDNYYNTTVSPQLSMNFGTQYDFSSSVPAPTSVVGNIATWNLSPITCTTAAPTSIHVQLEVPGTWLVPGDAINTDYMIMPTSGDSNIDNNHIIREDTVKSSFDPNDITVSPAGFILSGTQLQYTIRFENMGNDTAHNIYVLDTVSDYLDLSTFRLEMASAAMDIAVKKESGLNIIKFDFPNIKLLDSSHHGLCDGMLIFNIKTKTGLPDGTVIPNRVGIYFDDNEVIMTNTATDIIGIPSLSTQTINKQNKVELYPNPAASELTIKTEKESFNSYTITNSIGQVLVQEQVNNSITKVDVSKLAPGFYFVTLRGETGSVVKKFVKE